MGESTGTSGIISWSTNIPVGEGAVGAVEVVLGTAGKHRQWTLVMICSGVQGPLR